MRIFWTLLRRELSSFFLSLTGYVIIAAVTLLVGLSFVVLIAGVGSDPFTAPVTEMFYGTFYFWLVLLLATPVITMRLFALEKASGTFETLMTTPVGRYAGGRGEIYSGNYFLHGRVAAVVGVSVHCATFHESGRCAGRWHDGRNVSRNFSGRLRFSFDGLPRVGHFLQPDDGGDDQFRARRKFIFAGVSREIHAGECTLADAGASVF